MYHIFILNIYILRNYDKIDGPSKFSIRWIIVSYVVQSIPFLFYLSSIIDPVKGYRSPVFWFWDLIKVNNWFWCGCRWIGLIGFHVVGVDLGSICHRKTEWDLFFFSLWLLLFFLKRFLLLLYSVIKKQFIFNTFKCWTQKCSFSFTWNGLNERGGEKIIILM